MLELEDALSRVLSALPPPTPESVPLREAAGRVLADEVTSPIDLPPFDNSAVDGYAVRAADTAGASNGAPVGLRLLGRVPAGQAFAGELAGGACVQLFTGSPLPRGADAVVMQEDTRVDAARPDTVRVIAPAAAGDHVRRQGGDVAAGAIVSEAGQRMTAARLALLAAAGVPAMRVGRQPSVGLLATGSELREAGQPLAPGLIYESHRVALAEGVTQAGGRPRVYPIVPDSLAATRAALATALAECEIVVTCGGVSVGEMDFVKSAFEQLGGELQFWQVAIKPGRPFAFGRRGRAFLFGLPGNPVSALVTFALLVRPALLRWQGARDIFLPTQPGVLGAALANGDPRRHFMRVRVDPHGQVFSAGAQASHVLSALAQADGLVDVPAATTLPRGSSVRVLRWGG